MSIRVDPWFHQPSTRTEHHPRPGSPLALAPRMADHPALRDITIPIGDTPVVGRHGGPPDDGRHVPVVLVHGFGMSGTYLLPTARRLARTRAVWVPDLPGHGRSATPPAALDVPGLAAALLAWLDAAGVRRAALLGNSMGAQIVAEAATRRPGLAAALVLVGPTFDPSRPSVPALALRVLADVPRERPSLVPIVARDYLRMGPRRLWREFVAMRAHRIEPALAAAGVPTLVVRGERDPLASDAWCRAVAAAAGGTLEVVPGAGHAVNHSAAAALAGRVERFLARVADRAAGREALADAAAADRSRAPIRTR